MTTTKLPLVGWLKFLHWIELNQQSDVNIMPERQQRSTTLSQSSRVWNTQNEKNRQFPSWATTISGPLVTWQYLVLTNTGSSLTHLYPTSHAQDVQLVLLVCFSWVILASCWHGPLKTDFLYSEKRWLSISPCFSLEEATICKSRKAFCFRVFSVKKSQVIFIRRKLITAKERKSLGQEKCLLIVIVLKPPWAEE